jgi:hypothetical protein
MDGLSMLAQVIQSRKAAGTVTLKRTLSSVFPDVTGEMFAAGEAQLAGRKVGAEESLAFLFLGWRGSIVAALLGIRLIAVAVVFGDSSLIAGRGRRGRSLRG